MNNVIDQASDAGFANLRLLVERYPTLREFAKTASLDESEFEKLSSDSFAWPSERKFPIHTPEHTALSVGYSKLSSSIPLGVAVQLEKAAEIYNLTPAMFEEDQTEKIADDADYLLPAKKRFKVSSADEVPLAEEAYRLKFANLSMEDRAMAGLQLVKVAEKHGVTLHPSTQKLAGFTMTSTAIFKDWMGARKEAALKAKSPLASAFEKMAEAYTNVEEFIDNRKDQMQLASLVYRMDKQAGITHHYGKKLPTPLETVFNTDLARKDFVKISSALANKALLQSLPVSFWEDTLGPDISKEIAPDGNVNPEVLEQILPTLPADLKASLETQLAAYNK